MKLKVLNISTNPIVRLIDEKLEVLYGNLSEEDLRFLKLLLKQTGRENYGKWIHEHSHSIELAVKNSTEILPTLSEWKDQASRVLLILAVFQFLQSARLVLHAVRNNLLDQPVEEEHIPFYAGMAYSHMVANRPPVYPFDFDDPFSS